MKRINEVMTRDIHLATPDQTLAEAAAEMAKADIGCLPVGQRDKLVGMITDRDITVRATAMGEDPKTTRVRDAMTRDVLCCHEDDDVREATRLMERNQVRRLPVLNREDRLVGIVSLADLAVWTGDEQLSGEVLERVSEPAEPDR